ncbi:lipopolysaccharide biosynthesis protein [Paludibacter sp.]
MTSEALKNKTVSGVVWSGIERFSTQGVQFIIEMIMARLLMPSDYGLIGMLAIFMAISRTFIDSGFSNALIQKNDRTNDDLSTVFFFNLIVSIVVYLIIYFSAPLIEVFYEAPGLTLVTRVFSLTLIISALSAVSRTILVINVDFKTQAKISLIAIIFSGIIGIYFAKKDFGVWALVWMFIINLSIQTLLYHIYVRWRPNLFFSKSSFKSLFSFGSKLLITNLLSTLYDNLYTIVIGKKFHASDLGYYSKSDQLVRLPSTNIAFIISRVSFPILSQIQNDNQRLALAYKKYLSMSSIIVFPLMIGLATLAKPLIILLFTEKWSGMILLLQILCFDWIWDTMCKININLLLVKGYSNLILKLEVVKRIVSVSILVITLPFGLTWLCIGRVIYSFISVYINSYYTGKTIVDLNYIKQMKIVSPYFIMSIIMGCSVYFFISFFTNLWTQLTLGIILGIVLYLIMVYIIKKEEIIELIGLTKNLLIKNQYSK